MKKQLQQHTHILTHKTSSCVYFLDSFFSLSLPFVFVQLISLLVICVFVCFLFVFDIENCREFLFVLYLCFLCDIRLFQFLSSYPHFFAMLALFVVVFRFYIYLFCCLVFIALCASVRFWPEIMLLQGQLEHESSGVIF